MEFESPEVPIDSCTPSRSELQSKVIPPMNSATPFSWLARIQMEWGIIRTRVLWGPRLAALGPRTLLGRRLLVNNPRAVSIGGRVTLSHDFVIADLKPGRGETPKIVIGNDVTIMYRFQCNAAMSVRIGNFVLVASNVLITDSDHLLVPGGQPITRCSDLVTRPVEIQDNCWLGQNSVILKGVTIGHDSIIGANSVVTGNVPPYSVFAGNPARLIKTLDVPTQKR